jgi:hypothetical protein
MRRRKHTRPPSTVLEEIEKENKILGLSSEKKGDMSRKQQMVYSIENEFNLNRVGNIILYGNQDEDNFENKASYNDSEE